MKSILVLNVPEDFDYRRCSMGGDGNIYYEREGEQRVSIIGNIKNLRPLPKKEHYEIDCDGLPTDIEYATYCDGRNKVIDEITGETEWTQENYKTKWAI